MGQSIRRDGKKEKRGQAPFSGTVSFSSLINAYSIESALEKNNKIVAIFSPASPESEWTTFEIKY